ncbi:MAG TPA: hypothetical protein VN428_26080 [Bryobacteraceae bacterium]|nr:hypothetical protein [Bryobacteraceae bacterium]
MYSASPKEAGERVLAEWWPVIKGHARQMAWVLGGKGALLAANTLIMLLLARRLPLDTYGLFATFVGLQVLVSRALLAGLDNTVVRLANLDELRPYANDVMGTGLRILRNTSLGLVAVAMVLWPLQEVLGTHWPAWAVAAAVVGSVGLALVDYSYFCRLAELGYRGGARLQAGPALVRCAATAAVVYSTNWPPLVFLVYGGVSLGLGLLQVAPLRTARRPATHGLARRILRYSVWPATANVTAAFSLHQGTFLLAFMGLTAEAGIFGLALTLSLGFFTLKNAFYEYLLPRMVHVPSTAALPRFLTRSLLAAAAVATACIPVAALVGWALPHVLQPEMVQSVGPFYILSASMLLLIIQSPLEAASLYLMRPQFVTCGWIVRVTAIGAFGFALAPRWGASGAAAAQLAGGLVAFVFMTVVVFVTLRRAAQSGVSPVVNASAVQAPLANLN